jgi:hypothetical protein
MIIAALAVAPPRKPRLSARTNQKPKTYWTLHTQPNDAFTLKISDKVRTSIVGFKDIDDAIFIGKMIETHFVRQKEWPDTRVEGSLVLPSSQVGDVLHHIYVQKWEFNELKLTCTKNFLDMLSVESIINTKNGYSFEGSAFKFEAPLDFYKDRLFELFSLESKPFP